MHGLGSIWSRKGPKALSGWAIWSLLDARVRPMSTTELRRGEQSALHCSGTRTLQVRSLPSFRKGTCRGDPEGGWGVEQHCFRTLLSSDCPSSTKCPTLLLIVSPFQGVLSHSRIPPPQIPLHSSVSASPNAPIHSYTVLCSSQKVPPLQGATSTLKTLPLECPTLLQTAFHILGAPPLCHPHSR